MPPRGEKDRSVSPGGWETFPVFTPSGGDFLPVVLPGGGDFFPAMLPGGGDSPLFFPPCITCLVAVSNTFIKLTGPVANPPDDLVTTSPVGLSFEKLNPVPPPD